MSSFLIRMDEQRPYRYVFEANYVTNNRKFTVSRFDNTIEIAEKFTATATAREFPYRCCFNNKGQIMAFQESI